MPAEAKLKVTEIKGEMRNKKWLLVIPPYLSPTGMRLKLRFATKQEAEQEASRYKEEKRDFAKSAKTLSLTDTRYAKTLVEMIESRRLDLNLLELGKIAFNILDERNESRTFENLVMEYMEKKPQWSANYAKDFRNYCLRFPRVQKAFVSDLRVDDFLKVLNTFPATAKNACIRMLHPLFEYAVNRKYLKENPILTDEKVHIERKEVETVPNDIVEAMLNDALENDLEMVPYLVFGFFSGIRPEGEMSKVFWSDWDQGAKCLTIRAAICKTKVFRQIEPISDNAIAWLQAYQDQGGKMEGYICDLQKGTLKNRRQNILLRMGTNWKWIQDGMRHSFCSNWLTANGFDYNRCAALGGHDTKVLKRHYSKGLRKEDAAKYWQIFPKQHLEQKAAA